MEREVVRRGDIWWAELPEPTASEPGFRRPVVIVQADAFNRSRIRTVVVVTLTSNLRLASAPGNAKLLRGITGIGKDSIVNVSQIVTLDKEFLTEKVGQVATPLMRKIDEGIRLVLAL